MSAYAARGGLAHAKPLSERGAFIATLVFSLFVAVALSFPRAEIVWRTGAFFDSDDAMRAVQVRDFLAGQRWFDLFAHRLDPPYGLPMHWSRVVDVPLAGLNLFFMHFLSPEYAERATRLVFPFALLGLLLALIGWLASILSNAAARLTAVWLALLSGAMFLQFAPGRIDHHAPQIVTLAATLGLFLQGLDPRRAARLAVAAALMALSISISLENLPFFVVMIAALPLLFVSDGEAAHAQLLWFSAGALVAFPLLYAATVPPAGYFTSACDAFSFVHLAATLVGVIALTALALFASRLATRARFIAAAFAGAVTLASVNLIAPHCLGDPLGGLDPLLRDLWLSHVVEAKPLLSLYATAPGAVFATAVPVGLGLFAALFFAFRAQGVARRRWLLLAACVAAGFAAGLWQMRIFTSVTPLAMAPLAAAIVAAANRLSADVSPSLRAALIASVTAFVSPIGLALALPSPEDPDAGAERTCLAPDVLAPLAELPASRVVASFDLGAHILAHTPHSVFAAPYHRDNHGNRIAADAFLAPPDKAETLLRAADAQLVVWCPRAKAPSALATAAPDGLAAMLARGEAPAWLEPVKLGHTSLLVFALRPVEKMSVN
ncbi:hypothetical protein LG047_10870 [Methylocystis sp. WRRC1]|uniref:hypothetical protein n=1 Tax=Methylocystis sp. WRRC1 TaxID=1732014 RepID=UPI001D1380A3|nr:hypothetical protein [Methylocystis sp. WRRC1]MCC3245825.1 hypothetical protein [Methylocystis sp. WRRC1]